MPDPHAQPLSLTHGDFHTSQILIQDSCAAIIDFDHVYLGDAYRDLGPFLARLEVQLDSLHARRAAEEFCRQYEAAQPGKLVSDRLVWYQIAQFVKLATSSVTKLAPGWITRLDDYLCRAEALLSQQSAGRD